jgi:hypothetical protein
MRIMKTAAWMLALAAGSAVAQQNPTTPRPTEPTQPTQPGYSQPGTQPGTPGMRDRTQPGMTDRTGGQSAAQVIATWPAKQQEAYRKVSQKFGPPDEVSQSHLLWRDKGNLKAIVLMKESTPHLFPAPHEDFLAVCCQRKVPPEKVGELSKFDGSIMVNRTAGTVTSICDTLENDLIALNLANDIITDKKTVEEARQELAKQAMAVKGGQSAPYAMELQFRPDMAAADPDQPARTLASPESPLMPGEKNKDLDKEKNENPGHRPGEIPKQNPETPRR